MSTSWKRFLLLQVPVALLGFALLAEALAWTLAGVTMRRSRTDELALSVVSDPTNYRVILLADSITRNATARFALGPPGEVGNLATHAHFGVVGELLLLQRYLRTHATPQYVVLAFAPAMYQKVGDIRQVRYTLWYTFRDREERDLLKAEFPDIDDRDWLPAAADLQVRVFEPLLSLLKSQYLALRRKDPARVGAGSSEPDADAPTDASQQGQAAVDRAIADNLRNLRAPTYVEVLQRLCSLAQQYGFGIKVAWPPMPAELERALLQQGALVPLQRLMRALVADRCLGDEGFDFNRVRTYTASNFHIDMVHLFGDGWEQRYASDLRHYLSALADRHISAEVMGWHSSH
jgi:hypothetical protein